MPKLAERAFEFPIPNEIDGDVSLSSEGDHDEYNADWISFTGVSPVNPMAPRYGDPCHVDIEMKTRDVGIRLTAILSGGLPPTFFEISETFVFAVGRAEPAGEPWDDERQDPGKFFATLDLGPSEKRKIDVRTIPRSGTFRSDGKGHVFLWHFDGYYLEMLFELPMVENIGEKYGPRRVTVKGILKLSLGRGPFGDKFQSVVVPVPDGIQIAHVASYRCGNLDMVKRIAAAAAEMQD